MRELEQNSSKTGNDVMMLQNEKRQLEAKLKHSKNREDIIEREKENLMHEAYAKEEKIRSYEIEKAEKERIIGELSSQHEESLQMARDLDMQGTMYDKLQQQLIDEKMNNQNLAAEAKAAEKRAEILTRTKEENLEHKAAIQQLQKELTRREHVIQTTEKVQNNQNDAAFERMKDEVNAREAELVNLRLKCDEFRIALAEAERNADQFVGGVSSAELENMKKLNIEAQVERDQLKQERIEQQRRYQEPN